jgi:Peptidogalycan biosysnthesis/recognition
LCNTNYIWKASSKVFQPELINEFFDNSTVDAYAYLTSFENALPSKMKVQYLTCFHNNEIIALAFIQKFRFSAFDIKENNVVKKIALQFLFNIIPCHFAYCGSLFCIALPGLVFKKNIDTTAKADAIKTLTKKYGSTVTIIKDVDEHVFAKFDNDKNTFPASLDSTMELKIQPHWLSFDDYLNDLHHKYRQRAKKVLAAFSAVEARELSLSEIELYKEKIYQLYLNILTNQSFRLGKIEPNYFTELKKGLKENFEVTGYFYNNELIAFRSAFVMNDRIEVHFIGFDYTDNKSLQIYFNILYDNIDFAIAKKATVLELGRTAQDAKRVIGALPKKFNDIVYFKSLFFKKLSDFLYPRYNNNSSSQPERNPFK